MSDGWKGAAPRPVSRATDREKKEEGGMEGKEGERVVVEAVVEAVGVAVEGKVERVEGGGGGEGEGEEGGKVWWRVAGPGLPLEGARLHTSIEGRFITLFRHRNTLSCIDAICHHAGGPLTLGALEDIEDLGNTVVLCPWHKFMVDIVDGTKAYRKVEVQGGKPVVGGWVRGKVVQRVHWVREDEGGVYVVSNRYCSDI